MEWLGDNMTLQRSFIVFLNRVYFKKRVDVENLYRGAMDAKEVKAMLERNIERWIEEWRGEGRIEGRAEGRAEGIKPKDALRVKPRSALVWPASCLPRACRSTKSPSSPISRRMRYSRFAMTALFDL